ncbi:MAG: hypothetical protein HN354_11680 [Deltaproteobacteria bacterium]|jgi:hypothetical protein|nr:hypothetical protein [Deltaproteobacteria bacterium]
MDMVQFLLKGKHFLISRSLRLIMLRIDIIFTSEKATVLRLEGRVDRQSLPVLTRACEEYLKIDKVVTLSMEGIDHISKGGREYLKSIKAKIKFNSLSEYLKIEIL